MSLTDLKDVLALVGTFFIAGVAFFLLILTLSWIEDMNWGRKELQKVIDRLNEMEAAKAKGKRK